MSNKVKQSQTLSNYGKNNNQKSPFTKKPKWDLFALLILFPLALLGLFVIVVRFVHGRSAPSRRVPAVGRRLLAQKAGREGGDAQLRYIKQNWIVSGELDDHVPIVA